MGAGRQEPARRERAMMRLKRASFRLEAAQMERTWAVVSAHRDGCSVRDIAAAVGLSPTRVHQVLGDPAALLAEHAISALREIGWPAPEDPADDASTVADRLDDEADLLVMCAEWIEQLASGSKPVINLRPESDSPANVDHVLVDHARIVRILRRIASDIEELSRARRVADLSSADVETDHRLQRRRRFAEPPIDRPSGPMSIYQARRAWEEYERRLQRAGLPCPPNPYRHLDRSAK